MNTFLEALGASTSLVAVAEMGDKTQLLSFILATRFPRSAWAIIVGILLATLANHWLAAWVGGWIAGQIGPERLRWILALVFFGFAAWALIPDKLDTPGEGQRGAGAFATTATLFFIAEMGDKTQLATVALAAKYVVVAPVVIGTTLGMMVANVPAVLLGERLTRLLPLRWLRMAAAALFALFGLAILLWR